MPGANPPVPEGVVILVVTSSIKFALNELLKELIPL